MPQQLTLLAEAAAHPPAVASQREQYTALKKRAPLPPRSVPPAPVQGSLFAFQAAQQETLRPAPSAAPKKPPAPAVASPAHGERAKARDILAAIRTLKMLEEAGCPATPEERAILDQRGHDVPVAPQTRLSFDVILPLWGRRGPR